MSSTGRIAEYVVKLVGQNAQLMGQINQATAGLHGVTAQANAASRASAGLSSTLKGFAATAAGAFSVVAIEQFVSASIDAYEQSAKAQAKVAQAIKATSGVAGLSLQELTSIAAEFQKSTLFEDDSIMNGVTAQLLTFTNIAGINFKKAQAAALDLATVLDGDLQGTAIQLGKALNDPVQGLSALRKSGVSFSDDQIAVIKSLQETNRLAEAQTLILDALEQQYGGQARAAAEASTGLTQLKNSFGDLKEAIGGGVANSNTFQKSIRALKETVDKTTTALNDEATPAWKKFFEVLNTSIFSTDYIFKKAVKDMLGGLSGWSIDELQNLKAKQQNIGDKQSQDVIERINRELEAREKAASKSAGIVKLKSRSLEEVNTELELAVKNQKEVNVNDKASVEAVNKKVWALTAEKEAYEKLFTMRKDRGKNLDPMEERLNSIPLVTEKTPTPIAGIRIKPNKTYQVDALVEYGKQMDVITKKSLLYSDALETVIERKQATQAAIDALLSEGWAAESLDVQKLMTQLDLYNKQQTQITGISETTKDALNQLGNSFQQLGSSIGGAAGNWFTFAATLLEQIPTLITQITALTATQVTGSQATALAKNSEAAATNQSTAAKILEATVATSTGATEMAVSAGVSSAKIGETYASGVAGAAKMPFPANLVAIGMVVASIAAIVSSFPKVKKFASGGIVTGPTLGLMGEYPGAANNPEVIAPLSKLKGMMADKNSLSSIKVDDIVLEGSKIRYILKVVDRQVAARI